MEANKKTKEKQSGAHEVEAETPLTLKESVYCVVVPLLTLTAQRCPINHEAKLLLLTSAQFLLVLVFVKAEHHNGSILLNKWAFYHAGLLHHQRNRRCL